MGSLFFLSRPMGSGIVRFAYGIAVIVLATYVVEDIWTAASLDPAVLPSVLLLNAGILIIGFVAIRAVAEIFIAQIEIRDKLGSIEQNTLDARDKLGSVENNTRR
ncbi:hypothetical protein L2U69_03485 [Zavarzinia compransoris]|nr:hypothetical protein [Zavarzinia marina]